MRGRAQRHPAFETAVFAAALLLSAFIARELWVRRFSPRSPLPSVTSGRQPLELNPSRPPLPAHRTELAVTGGGAPIKFKRVYRRKPKPSAVPVPK